MSRSNAGFSLLELIIAIALLAFIAIAIAGGIRFGARAWEASDNSVAALERVQGAQNLLRMLLQRAVPRELDPTFAVDLDLFRGTSTSLSFTADAPSSFGAEGATRFELRIEGEVGARRLVLGWQGANMAAGQRRQTLIENAGAIAIAYAAPDQSGALRWVSDWSTQSGAPALVMIRATYPRTSKQRWPALIVRTRIMRDPLCVFDTATLACHHA